MGGLGSVPPTNGSGTWNAGFTRCVWMKMDFRVWQDDKMRSQVDLILSSKRPAVIDM